MSPTAATGILRRAARRGRTLANGLTAALESLASRQLSPGVDATSSSMNVDDNTAQANHLVGMLSAAPTVTAKWAKGTGGPAGDEAQNLVAYALRADPGGVGQGHNTNYVTTDPEVYQQHGSNVGPMGTLRAGNGATTGGVPFTTHALTSEGTDASEDGTGRGTPLVPTAFDWKAGATASQPGVSTDSTSSLGTTKQDAVAAAAAVRRLTPVECERLQGYPDNWTAHRRALVLDGNHWCRADPEAMFGAEQADAPRYRQLGNSIAVPVFAWVARRQHDYITNEREA